MTKPLICATVTAASMDELRRRRDEVRDADLVELRLDGVAHPDVAGALADRRCPVLITCRPAWEGGAFDGPEADRRRLLEQALALGAEFVDVEWRAGFVDLITHEGGRRIVLSMHDFNGVPDDLPEIADAMRQTGAQVIKIAVKTSRLSDCLPLLDVGAQENPGQTVVIGMGEPGLATRVLAAKFGSAWTYAGALRDIGQVTASELVDRFRFRSLTRDTAVYGIAGKPVSHSVSPAMHNAAMREAKLDAVYLPLAAADVDDFQTFARGIGLLGASVTIPFKVSLFDRMDEADPLAQRIGAINTVRLRGGRWEGTNTDAIGFLKPLDRRSIALSGLHASILGAGGSARAVAMALAARGAKVRIHARRDEQSRAVAQAADVEVGAWPVEPGSWDLLVNCTPVGMFPHTDASPLDIGEVRGPIVYDLIYNPARTKLLRDAASNGSATIGGLEMLVGQAQEQFRWWTGIEPSSKVMQAAATARLREFSTDEDHVL